MAIVLSCEKKKTICSFKFKNAIRIHAIIIIIIIIIIITIISSISSSSSYIIKQLVNISNLQSFDVTHLLFFVGHTWKKKPE